MEGRVNSVKKMSCFYNFFFADTHSVSLFSQILYYNETFQKYFQKFLLQKISNWTSDSEFPLRPHEIVILPCGVSFSTFGNEF